MGPLQKVPKDVVVTTLLPRLGTVGASLGVPCAEKQPHTQLQYTSGLCGFMQFRV